MGILHCVPLQMALAKLAKIDYGAITVKQMTGLTLLNFNRLIFMYADVALHKWVHVKSNT